MGRILCSVTDDSLGWHDALGGLLGRRRRPGQVRRGALSGAPQRLPPNAHDGFLIELAKYGLGPRDLSPNVNFFSKVAVGRGRRDGLSSRALRAGQLRRTAGRDERPADPQHLPAPARPEPALRAEAGPSRVRRVPPPGPDDPCRTVPARERARLHPHGAVLSYERHHDRAKARSTRPQAVYSEIVPAGESWIHPIAQGQTFRIVDLEGNQAVDTLFYNAARHARTATTSRTRSAPRATSISRPGRA